MYLVRQGTLGMVIIGGERPPLKVNLGQNDFCYAFSYVQIYNLHNISFLERTLWTMIDPIFFPGKT